MKYLKYLKHLKLIIIMVFVITLGSGEVFGDNRGMYKEECESLVAGNLKDMDGNNLIGIDGRSVTDFKCIGTTISTLLDSQDYAAYITPKDTPCNFFTQEKCTEQGGFCKIKSVKKAPLSVKVNGFRQDIEVVLMYFDEVIDPAGVKCSYKENCERGYSRYGPVFTHSMSSRVPLTSGFVAAGLCATSTFIDLWNESFDPRRPWSANEFRSRATYGIPDGNAIDYVFSDPVNYKIFGEVQLCGGGILTRCDSMNAHSVMKQYIFNIKDTFDYKVEIIVTCPPPPETLLPVQQFNNLTFCKRDNCFDPITNTYGVERNGVCFREGQNNNEHYCGPGSQDGEYCHSPEEGANFFKAPCKKGDFCTRPAPGEGPHCANSFIRFNQLNNKHCFANVNTGGVIDNTEGMTCGENIKDADEGKKFKMCHPESENNRCVGYNNNDETKLVVQAENSEPNEGMPDTGVCLDCVYDENDRCDPVDNGLLNSVGLTSNCCNPQHQCIFSDSTSENGTCKQTLYKTCNNIVKTYQKMILEAELYIAPGEICDYNGFGGDDNFCRDKCATKGNTREVDGNKLCPDAVANNQQGCNSNAGTCGCASGITCEEIDGQNGVGTCTNCAAQGQLCNTSADCCDNDDECTDDANSSRKTCRLNCSARGQTCNEGDRCCNAGQACSGNSGSRRCVDSRCLDREGQPKTSGCCGKDLKCNATSQCVPETANETACDNFIRPPIGPTPGPGRPTATLTVNELISSIVAILYPLAIILGMLYLILGGYTLMTSQGNPDGVKAGQEMITSAVIGMLFIILSATILRFVINVVFNITL